MLSAHVGQSDSDISYSASQFNLHFAQLYVEKARLLHQTMMNSASEGANSLVRRFNLPHIATLQALRILRLSFTFTAVDVRAKALVLQQQTAVVPDIWLHVANCK